MASRRLCVLAVSLFLVFAGAKVFAQTQTASLTGEVMDPTGAAVPGATVTVADPTRGIKLTVTSDGSGDYVIPELQPGDHYQITVTKAGFKSVTQQNVSLQVAQAAKINLTMAVGDVSQSVTVSAEPPQLDTQSSSLSQVITGQTVEDLPLNGRSTFRLIALTPGVTFSQSAYGQFGDVAVNSTWDTNFSIDGGRAQSNEILVDGTPTSAGFFDQITTLPMVDETQEFRVLSNNIPAIYGRYSGGVINVTTKGGTNDLHGDAYEFARNSAFSANTFFQKQAGLPNVPFSMNQFGGTIGGPVRIPKLYNGRDRTFFFAGYQGTRRLQGSTLTFSVPTAAERTGNFVGDPIATSIWNPFSSNITTTTGGNPIRQQLSYMGVNNVIDPMLFDKVALKIIPYLPLPNTGAAGAIANNYISNAPFHVNQDIYSGRIDQNVTQKYHLAGRYEYSNTNLQQPNSFGNVATSGTGAVGTTRFTNQSFALTNVYQFNDHFLINLNYGWARWYQSRQTLSYGFDNSTLGFPASFLSDITIPMFPTINFATYSGTNGQSYLNNGNDSHALLISATWLKGKQTINVGVDGRVHRINFFNVGSSAGTFGFAVSQTEDYTENAGTLTAVAKTGDAFASFLLGAGNSGSFPIVSGVELQDFYGAVYVQDDIRLTQKLTVNLGVRYDGESAYDDRHNELSYFNKTIASPAANLSFPNLVGGLVFANTAANGGSRTVYTTQLHNFAPRLGFAWNPYPKTSVRGGYGISYAPLETANNAVGISPNTGYSSTTNWDYSNNGGYTPANLLANPYPQGVVQPTGNTLGAGTQLGQAMTSLWNHTPKQPYSMQYNLDLQQQFPHGFLLDLGYAGSKGEHLTGTFDNNTLNPQYLNQPTSSANLTALVANPFAPYVSVGTLSQAKVTERQLLLPFPQFQSVQEQNNPYGWSTYNSAQLKGSKRMSGGLQFLAAFTWSKLISNVNAQNAPIGTTNNTSVQNYYNLGAEKAISELDQPYNFVFNTTYELPFGRGKRFGGGVSKGMDTLIGGWRISGIWVEQSGFPLTFSAPNAVGAANRPNLVLGVNPKIVGSRSDVNRTQAWFNNCNGTTCPAAFLTPQPYYYGTMPRSWAYIRGPGIQNADATLQKDIYFTERFRAELRAEMFNVTNTPHFQMPNTAVGNAAFGTISAVVLSPPQREVQFAGKFYF